MNKSLSSNNDTLLTADGCRIACRHYQRGCDKAVIVAHGFYNNKDTVLLKRITGIFGGHYDVVSFDFRGHGKSGGRFSWTAREPLDLRAVLAFAKEKKYARIGVVGFSLGAAVALIEAGRGASFDSVIAVSAPGDFWKIDYHFWEPDMLEDLKLNFGTKGRGKGARPGSPFLPKVRPLDVVDKITPRPVLFIHGSQDWLIKPAHSRRLFEKAREPKALEILTGGGHAERMFDAFPDRLADICLAWFGKTL